MVAEHQSPITNRQSLTAVRYWYSRFLFERSLGLVNLVAFAVAANQFLPLLGERDLLPATRFTQIVPFRASPSLFFLASSDGVFRVSAWMLYLSFVNVGQTFHAFGWETLLLEAGFLAIFLGGSATTPSVWLVRIYRWLLFRVMFGAGLIKLRGDPCWRDFTCLNYYFETQPIPNPLS